MTPALIAALQDGTATNEMIAESRGWRKSAVYSFGDFDTQFWTPPDNSSPLPCPAFLNDIRLTLAALRAALIEEKQP